MLQAQESYEASSKEGMLHAAIYLKLILQCHCNTGCCVAKKIASCYTSFSFAWIGNNLAIWLLLFKQRGTQFKPIKRRLFCWTVAKNNSWNNGDRHKIHEIFLIICFIFDITPVWKTAHSSAMTQIKAHLMENHCTNCSQVTLCPLRYLETFFPQI